MFKSQSSLGDFFCRFGPYGSRLLLLMCLLPVYVNAQQVEECSVDGSTYLRLAAQSIEQRQFERAGQRISRALAEGCFDAQLELELGEALQQEGDNSAAAQLFEQAQTHASDADTQAMAIARYAEVLASDVGPNPEALDLLQFARRAHSNPPEWMDALALRMDTQLLDAPFERERVTRSFSSNRMGRMSMAQIKPIVQSGAELDAESGRATTAGGGSSVVNRSLAFRTHFKRGSSELDPTERAKVAELAEALASASLIEKRFRLVGHTDVTGKSDINQSLSVQRARTVYNLVLAVRPELVKRLTFDGKGESELLYSNASSEIEHRLNRRVQVVLE